jgi:predicted dehydrogenase
MHTIKVGIIGCGGIAMNKHLPALKKLDGINIVAFCDLDLEKAISAKIKFGHETSTVFTDYKKLLNLAELDAVHVLTPNSSHAQITVDALNSGAHVMCEKPMAKTAKEARTMLEAAKKTGKLLTIGYQNRFRPDSQFLYSACRRGDLGDIYFSKAHAIRRRAVPTWGVFLNSQAQGGGPLIDIGTHALDLTLWMMDNYELKSVQGTVYRKLADQVNTANAWGDWDPDEFTVEDSAFAFITMKNGATIFLESSWALNTLDIGEAKTTLCGTKAGADMREDLRINSVDFGKMTTLKPSLGSDGVDFYEGDTQNPEDLEAQDFYNAIRKGTPLTVTPEQALVVTEILEAVYLSAEIGQTIYFD